MFRIYDLGFRVPFGFSGQFSFGFQDLAAHSWGKKQAYAFEFRGCRRFLLVSAGYEGFSSFGLGEGGPSHRLLSSSFLGLPYRFLNMNHKKGTT